MEIDYELDVTGKGGDFRVLRESIVVYSKDLKVAIDTMRNTLTVTADMSKELNDIFGRIRSAITRVREVLEESVKTEDEILEKSLKSRLTERSLLLSYERLLHDLGI
jgi:hypothetical protein